MTKKKKKKKSISILQEVDKNLNGTYDDIMTEIQEMQTMLAVADNKARKLAKKKGKKNPKMYNYENMRKEARKHVIEKMEGTNFIERIQNIFNDLIPIVIVIARLVASLICAILSIPSVKVNIKPQTLEKLNIVYQKAMAIS